jgi:hypothetical protein
MIEFVRYILRIGDTNEHSIINKDTLWLMFEEQYTKPRDPKTNGLTWFTDKKQLGELVVFHSGTNQGFISMIALMPERKLGFIIFSNSTRFEDLQNQLAIEILGLMLETKWGITIIQEMPAEKVDVSRDTLERYVGKYILNGEIIEVIVSGDQAKVIYQGQKINMVPISQSRFRLSHWLADVEGIELEFFVDSPDDEDIMVINMSDCFICPRYPDIVEEPASWGELVGKYDIYPRIPSAYSDEVTMGKLEIKVKDGVLLTSDNKVLKPISNTEILIVGGIFDGETMIHDTQTGTITWQNVIYKPLE